MTYQAILESAHQLSYTDRIRLIQAIQKTLKQSPDMLETRGLVIRRAKPITDFSVLTGDWWPEDESIDDMLTYIYESRRQDAARGYHDPSA